MTNYMGQALQEINPCGIESQPSTHCKYTKECATLGRASGGFVCLSKMGYQVTEYLIQGSNVNKERRDLRNHLNKSLDKLTVDPKKTRWTPIKLDKCQLSTVVDEIISRGEELSRTAIALGSCRNPLDIDCSVDDIIADL